MHYSSLLLGLLTLVQDGVVYGRHADRLPETLTPNRQLPRGFRPTSRLLIIRRRLPSRLPPLAPQRSVNRSIPPTQQSFRAIDPFQVNARARLSLSPPPALSHIAGNSIARNNVPIRPRELVAVSFTGQSSPDSNNTVKYTSTERVPMDSTNSSQRSSLLQLLEERKTLLRDERDLMLIRQYLTVLNQIRLQNWANADQRLEAQVAYIEKITDADIQREVLKIFVKDMVEKSGFLDQKAIQVQDIDSLRALIDKIGLITDKFTQTAKGAGPEISIPNSLTSFAETTTVRISPHSIPSQSSNTNLRQRIITSLTNYDRDAHLSGRSASQGSLTSDPTLQSFQGRAAEKPVAGLSIFGDSTVPDNIISSQPTVSSEQNTDAKRDGFISEPLGGNDAYWTHLRAGLADMLCSLCRQRQDETCIKRYCESDKVKTETETPTTPMIIAPIV